MNNVSQNSLSAIVLAGGLSSRMGQDKALMAIEGTPMLTRICGIAKQCADPVWVVTPWVERYQPIVEGVRWVEEVQHTEEPNGSLIGFIQGLEKVETEWVLLLACDLPNLRLEVLQHWKSLLSQTEAAALLPKNPEGWWEPLCGFYRQNNLERLQTYVAGGGRSHQGWLAQQRVDELGADAQMLLNCNTPEDLLAKALEPAPAPRIERT
jgi:molybdenum cofactor guanylyltransferase